MVKVLQDWVEKLGLRHQGTLLTAIRGCDTTPKEEASKALTRVYRAMVLNPHCGDPKKALTFIELPETDVILHRMHAVERSHDHLPHHFLMHLIHAAEIVGFCHPKALYRDLWRGFYETMCQKMHMRAETLAELNKRLNADETTFGASQ